jgi:hypothetical protein
LSRPIGEAVDAQVDGRARGERPPLLHRPVAENPGEGRREPFRIIAGDMVGRVDETAGFERDAFSRAQRRRRVSLAAEQRVDLGRAVAAQLAQHAKHFGARAGLAHDPRRRGLAAQSVINEAGDGGAILRAREAMRLPPILQGVGGGAAARREIGEDVDGGGNAGGGDHSQLGLVRNTKKARWPGRLAPPRRFTDAGS